MVRFTEQQIIDFHTHQMRHSATEDVVEILSIHLGQDKELELFTVGFHPWSTPGNLLPAQLRNLEIQFQRENCLALGEMGLDKLKGPPLDMQTAILKQQLELAKETKASVIIHCVRAIDQLLSVKKEFPEIDKWCIHGYSRHATLAKQLISNGFYLSLMPNMPEDKLSELLKVIPIDRLFLETDSMKQANIIEVYQEAAALLEIDLPTLKRQISRNANDFFNL